ncbi:hypothetical protein JK232_02755 [Nissabacter archeti]|uniref:Uncharacterized protein n=1 Tax=Nissabacter archeti TaxID=1917880 RepID=A0ABS5JCY1_9GAMM|nr:hypothetical protein [Nissabacter archeti]MBS0967805.1 hypothetical protein [Nissabacter archeti]
MILIYSGAGGKGADPNEEEASAFMSPFRIGKIKSAKVLLSFYDIVMEIGSCILPVKLEI